MKKAVIKIVLTVVVLGAASYNGCMIPCKHEGEKSDSTRVDSITKAFVDTSVKATSTVTAIDTTNTTTKKNK